MLARFPAGTACFNLPQSISVRLNFNHFLDIIVPFWQTLCWSVQICSTFNFPPKKLSNFPKESSDTWWNQCWTLWYWAGSSKNYPSLWETSVWLSCFFREQMFSSCSSPMVVKLSQCLSNCADNHYIIEAATACKHFWVFGVFFKDFHHLHWE